MKHSCAPTGGGDIGHALVKRLLKVSGDNVVVAIDFDPGIGDGGG